MKVDLKIPFTDLAKKPIVENGETVMLGKVVANHLANSSKGEPVKLFGWAEKLYNGESLELDEADYDTLYNFVKDSEHLSNAIKAQALRALKKSEKAEKAE